MIDDEFWPDRLQLRALGHLLLQAQAFPLQPAIREVELYERVYERYVGDDRQEWLEELARHRLIKVVENAFHVGDQIGSRPIDVCLTPAGTYYSISRSHIFGENARTPTDDFPDSIVDTPWTIQSYFAPTIDRIAPTSDSFVRFDHNEEDFVAALRAVEAVSEALASDNEIGALRTEVRDEQLSELQAIRMLLEKREGWAMKLLSVAGMTLCYLAAQFADRPVGYLAEQAWHAIQKIIGLS